MPDNADEDCGVDGLRCRNLDCQRCHPHDVPISWTVGLLDLPAELQMEIFLNLFNQQNVVSLRLTCRQLENVYQRIAATVSVDQRERIAAPVRKFIEFLDRFKLPNGRARHPPPGGWSHIQPSSDNGLKFKTPFVVDILRHLSYIFNPEPEFETYLDGCITHRSTMVDYSETDHYQGGHEDTWLKNFWRKDDKPSPSEGRHILALAWGRDGPGHSIYIDTWTGLVYEDEDGYGPCCPVILAQDFFSDRIKSLERFDEVFVPGEDTIYRRSLHYAEDDSLQDRFDWDPEERFVDHGPDDDPYDAEAMERQGEYDGADREIGDVEDADWIRHLYFKHGWPGERWDKGSCLRAGRESVERRRQRRLESAYPGAQTSQPDTAD